MFKAKTLVRTNKVSINRTQYVALFCAMDRLILVVAKLN